MSAEVAEVLRKAREAIGLPEQWGKDAEVLNDGKRCVGLAIAFAWDSTYGDDRPYGRVLQGPVPSVERARRAFMLAVGVAVGDDEYIRGCDMFSWNDAPERTHAEVLAAFDKAIATEEAS